LNSVFGFLRRRSNFFENPKSVTQCKVLAAKHHKRAASDSVSGGTTSAEAKATKKKEASATAAATVTATTTAAVSKPDDDVVDVVTPAAAAVAAAAVSNNDSKSNADDDNKEKPSDKLKPDGRGSKTDSYVWDQSLSEITASVPIASTLRAKDLQVVLRKNHISIKLKNKPDEVIVDGDLHAPIQVATSTWAIGRCWHLSSSESVNEPTM
jgi:nuclear migration protein NudC